VAGYADTYFVITEASTFFLALYSAGAALFRVMGNARISMEVSLVMNAVNVTGNGILIFGFHRGVGGVAVPTLISRIVAAAAMTVLLRRRDLTVHLETPFRFHHDRMMIRNILRIGVPNGVEGSMFQLGKILLLSVATVFGTASVAANAIGNTVCNFQCLAPSSIGLGMVTVVSRCVGAGDYEKARFYTRKLVKWGYASMALANLLTSVLLPVILLAYGLSDTADAYARVIVWSHAAMGTFLWPLAFELPQALRAAGDTRFTMTVSTISMWTCRVVLGVVFARTLGFGVLGIWYSMYLDWVVRDVFFVLRYRGRRWETMALRD
jgi:Na+-driven multidrug efflux pump